MQRLATRKEARKYIESFGKDAYAKAEEALCKARRQRNLGLADFLSKVMRHIEKRRVAVKGLPPTGPGIRPVQPSKERQPS